MFNSMCFHPKKIENLMSLVVFFKIDFILEYDLRLKSFLILKCCFLELFGLDFFYMIWVNESKVILRKGLAKNNLGSKTRSKVHQNFASREAGVMHHHSVRGAGMAR